MLTLQTECYRSKVYFLMHTKIKTQIKQNRNSIANGIPLTGLISNLRVLLRYFLTQKMFEAEKAFVLKY